MADTELSEYALRRADHNRSQRLVRDLLGGIRAAVRGLPRSCPVHGQEFAAAGLHPWGEPRCPSCRVPSQVARLLAMLDEAVQAQTSAIAAEIAEEASQR